MIKAKKGLLIALFAAMMVFAFGATSAFATDYSNTATWDLQNHTVTFNGQTYGGVTVTFNVATGKTTADFNNTVDEAHKTFYDLNGAEISNVYTPGRPGHWDAVGTNYDYDGYTALDGKRLQLTLVRPAYATDDKAAGTKSEAVTLDTWNTTAKIVELEESTATQTGSVSVEFAAQNTEPMELDGTVASKTIYVQGTPAVKGLLLDDSTTAATSVRYTANYDGKEHTIVANEVSGYTVAYEKFNKSTGKWDVLNGTAITFKNVADNGSYRAVYKKAGEADAAYGATINMSDASGSVPTFGFDTATLSAAGNKVPEGTDPASFIIGQNVLDVDAEEAAKYFADVYDIKTKANGANESIVTWSISDKEGVKPADIYKAYETFSENYGLTSRAYAGKTQRATSVTVTVTPAVDPNTQIDDITFTLAPNATYHVKKAKKMKATKSFTVAAEAKSGNAISYKLTTPNKKISIDSATGKITVKKGLKKGTYKVTVKALTDAGNGYMACKESVQLTIKVKK